jgi:hypothetical protein
MTTTNPNAQSQYETYEPPFQLSRYVGVLKAYAPVIILSLLVVMAAYITIAVILYLAAPSQRIATQYFRLDFAGATEAKYPNDEKFSPNDIISTPVLLSVYEANGLSRFIGFPEFSRAVYVTEENLAYQNLLAEYRARLSDVKLMPVDRDRLEKEFEAKRDALRKAEYTLNLASTANMIKVPNTTVRKVLNDILSEWARWAAQNHGVLTYNVRVVSPRMVDDVVVDPGNRIMAAHMLRMKVADALDSVKNYQELPGVHLVHTKDGRTIDDIRTRLEEMQRFRVEPLATMIQTSTLMGDRGRAMRFLETQRDYDQRQLRKLEHRVAAIRETLETYRAPRPEMPSSQKPAAEGGDAPVSAVLSDNFLNRMIELAETGADQQYRQKLADDLRNATLAAIPATEAVAYTEGVLERVRSGALMTTVPPAAEVEAEIEMIKRELRSLITNINEIHRTVSRNLNPATHLYTLIGPVTFSVQRTASVERLVLSGVALLMVATFLAIVLALLHNRLREEERESTQTGETPETAAA